MGVGKTTVSKILKELLGKSVFLDGDSCWNYKKDHITAEDKKEVIRTIVSRLNAYLEDFQLENIVFCWVMHEESIMNAILSKLKLNHYELINVSLICDKESLIKRLSYDISQGIREQDVIQRSLDRLPLYLQLSTIKIDTTDKEPSEVASEILRLRRTK